MKEGSLKRAGLLIGALTGNDHRYVHAVPNGSLQENYAIIRTTAIGRKADLSADTNGLNQTIVWLTPVFRQSSPENFTAIN